MVAVIVVFLILVAATDYAVLRPGRVAVAITLVASLAWLVVDSPVEGRTLVVLAPTHGVTIGDLASVVAMAIAVAAWGIHSWDYARIDGDGDVDDEVDDEDPELDQDQDRGDGGNVANAANG